MWTKQSGAGEGRAICNVDGFMLRHNTVKQTVAFQTHLTSVSSISFASFVFERFYYYLLFQPDTKDIISIILDTCFLGFLEFCVYIYYICVCNLVYVYILYVCKVQRKLRN